MATHGGRRPGAGRKPGSTTKRTREIAEAIAKGEAETPLEFLLNVMRNAEEDMARRIDAAKAAAQYVHPKLSSVEAKQELTGKDGAPLLPTRVEIVPLA